MKIIQTILNLVLLAGAILLLLFTVLSGSTTSSPINKFYWLDADTSNIPGAFAKSQWSFWGVCDANNLNDCRMGPAYAISPVDNFGTTDNVPQPFVDNRDNYWYLSKAAFAFLIIAIAFSCFAFLIDIFGLCFTPIDKVVAALVTMALIFVAGFVAFETAVVVMARDAFRDAGLYAHVPTKLMAIIWTAFVCILLVWFNTIGATITASFRKHMNRVNNVDNANAEYYQPQAGAAPINDESSFTRAPGPETKEDTNSGGIRFFKIKRNQKASDEESV